MTVNNEKHKIMITLIHNSCDSLSEWAKKTDCDKMSKLLKIITIDSENIYNRLSSSKETDDEYNYNLKKLENIYAFLGDLFPDMEDFLAKPLDDTLWEYFTKIISNNTARNKEFKKYEINEN